MAPPNSEPVIITLQDYTTIRLGMEKTSNKVDNLETKVDKLSGELNNHMEYEEGERKKVYRALVVLGVLLTLQLFGVTLDPFEIVKMIL